MEDIRHINGVNYTLNSNEKECTKMNDFSEPGESEAISDPDTEFSARSEYIW